MIDQTVADKLAIRDVLSRYCRGLDRMDKEMTFSVFSPECRANYHGMYEGSAQGFIDWAWDVHAGMERHSHQITNVLIELDGNHAVSEAYVTVALWTLGPDTRELTCRGRYLDRWEKHEGSWRVVEREHVLDMQTENGVPQTDAPNPQSSRDQNDASFRFFARG
jgi:hypothetical protein